MTARPDAHPRAHRQRQAHQQQQHPVCGGSAAGPEFEFTSPDGTPLHPASVTGTFEQLAYLAGLPTVRLHDLRHGAATLLQGRGVASDASLPARREDGAIRDTDPGLAGQRPRRQSEPAGQTGRDRTVLLPSPGCGIQSGCIGYLDDAAEATKRIADQDRCRQRPSVKLTYSTGLVNRSLPVSLLGTCACR